MYIVVSSANNIDLTTFKLSGKSFVYIINNNGPNTDPCGTPHYVEPRICPFQQLKDLLITKWLS